MKDARSTMSCRTSPEEKIVLLLSRLNPSPGAIRDAGDILKDEGRPVDFDSLLNLAAMNGVSPLLYHNLKTNGLVPENVMCKLRNTFLWTVGDNTRKAEETLRILALLRTNGVETIPLKGPVASDIIFGNPGLYPSSDIDILVKPSDLSKTRNILLEAGYEESEALPESDMLRSSYHLVFRNERDVVEVHWKLAFRYFEIPPDFWWQDAVVLDYRGTKMYMISTERYLLYTVFRLYRHAFRPLRFLVLTAEIINSYGDGIDWHKLLAFSREYRMDRLVLFTLKLLRDLLGADVPDEIVDRRISGYGWLKRLVLSGFFCETARIHVRMLALTVLQDTPLDTMKVLLSRVLPGRSEIRLRYCLPRGSGKVYLCYLLNPFLLLFGKRKDRRV